MVVGRLGVGAAMKERSSWVGAATVLVLPQGWPVQLVRLRAWVEEEYLAKVEAGSRGWTAMSPD